MHKFLKGSSIAIEENKSNVCDIFEGLNFWDNDLEIPEGIPVKMISNFTQSSSIYIAKAFFEVILLAKSYKLG